VSTVTVCCPICFVRTDFCNLRLQCVEWCPATFRCCSASAFLSFTSARSHLTHTHTHTHTHTFSILPLRVLSQAHNSTHTHTFTHSMADSFTHTNLMSGGAQVPPPPVYSGAAPPQPFSFFPERSLACQHLTHTRAQTHTQFIQAVHRLLLLRVLVCRSFPFFFP
jgi:hypothetical protein